MPNVNVKSSSVWEMSSHLSYWDNLVMIIYELHSSLIFSQCKGFNFNLTLLSIFPELLLCPVYNKQKYIEVGSKPEYDEKLHSLPKNPKNTQTKHHSWAHTTWFKPTLFLLAPYLRSKLKNRKWDVQHQITKNQNKAELNQTSILNKLKTTSILLLKSRRREKMYLIWFEERLNTDWVAAQSVWGKKVTSEY